MRIRTWVALSLSFLAVTLPASAEMPKSEPAIKSRKLPYQALLVSPGFQLSIYTDNVPEARQMAMGDKGTLFVGTNNSGVIYALVDRVKDKDKRLVHAEDRFIVASGLNKPSGVAFKDGSLYVAEAHRIIRFDKIEEVLPQLVKPVVVTDNFPADDWDGRKYIKFGPDGKLYVSVGAGCNACVKKDDERYGTIMRMNPDGTEMEVYAKGIRQAGGFDWHPETGVLWFTDQGRELMGPDTPPDELNGAPELGMDFGFPYCHGKIVSDPEYGMERKCEEFTAPKYEFHPHVGASGLHFYRGAMFPETFKNRLFMGEHGSWEQERVVGSQIGVMRFKSYDRIVYGIVAKGWIIENEEWGRPYDVIGLKDGSVLISDDEAGVIYRVFF